MTTDLRNNAVIRAVIFDWARVIRDVSWRYAAEALSQVVGFTDKQKMKDACFPALLERERGTLARDEFWDGVIRAYGMTPDEALREAFARAYQAVASEPFPEVMTLLRDLRKHRSELPVVILSNGAPEVMEVAEAGEERRLVDAAFYSCLMGVRKPEPQAFQIVLDTLQVTPEQTLFIDDQQNNVDAAAALGLQVVLFESIASVASIRARLELP